MTMLEVRDLHKVYANGVHALKGVSFDVEKGEFLVVIGLSGSGKSTLLRCINRLHEPTSGTIHLNGTDITKLQGADTRALRASVGMVFQHFNLVARRSVLTNVLTGALSRTGVARSVLGLWTESERALALEKLQIVGLEEKADVRADDLSGGQQQRVAIARALLQGPELLLADEPVASLDPATSHTVMRYLDTIHRDLGVTVICNLHFLSLVRQYATRVIALRAGEVVFTGSPKDIDKAWFKRIYGEDAVEVSVA